VYHTRVISVEFEKFATNFWVDKFAKRSSQRFNPKPYLFQYYIFPTGGLFFWNNATITFAVYYKRVLFSLFSPSVSFLLWHVLLFCVEITIVRFALTKGIARADFTFCFPGLHYCPPRFFLLFFHKPQNVENTCSQTTRRNRCQWSSVSFPYLDTKQVSAIKI